MLVLIADCFGREIQFPLIPEAAPMGGGSTPDNRIYLPYRGVSRKHFQISSVENRWFLQDQESRNGTYLNGKKVAQAEIRDGDVIQAGTISLHVATSEQEIRSVEDASAERVAGKPGGTEKVEFLPIRKAESHYVFPMLDFPEDVILGHSPEMFPVYHRLHSLVDSEANVLLIAETGCGKEVFAQTLHRSGKRSEGPFVAVNCGAIPQELAEAELFGIKKKAATDVDERAGKFTLAHGGTLFLDELSALPMTIQAKILRVLETRNVEPVGSERGIPLDIRIVGATNEEPQDLIRQGRLRKDLYYRIATVEIRIPPLRNHKADLQVLIPGLLSRLAQQEGKFLGGVTGRLLQRLHAYNYPGNIRELKNILHNLVASAHPGEILDLPLLPSEVLANTARGEVDDFVDRIDGGAPLSLHELLDQISARLVRNALQRFEGSISKSAAHLGITPPGLRKMILRLKLDLPRTEEPESPGETEEP